MTGKLALGTVQFGLDYGISNTQGQVPLEEVKQLLHMAFHAGIDTLDTAYAYGESERVLGRALDDTMQFRIVTKFPAENNNQTPLTLWQESRDRLGGRPIYGYLLHNYHSFRDRLYLVDLLQELRAEGKVQRTGFSLYHPDELEEILHLGLPFELLQIPFSILDQRFAPYFGELKRRGVEIHTRSAFLQGLVFCTTASLDSFFRPCFGALERIARKANELHLSLGALCLGFCLAQPDVDRVVIGVESRDNLKQNILSCGAADKIKDDLASFHAYSIDMPEILNPSLWPRA